MTRNFASQANWREWCRTQAASNRRIAAAYLASVREFGRGRAANCVTEAVLARGRALEAIARARTVKPSPLP